MKRIHTTAAALALLLLACGDDDVVGPTDAGDPPRGPDAAGRDAGEPPGPRVIASFDGAAYELPESLAYHDGRAYVSFLNGAVVTVDADGTVTPFGSVAIDPPGSAYGLGVAVAPDGTVYLAMSKASAESAFPAGVYRIPPIGGEGALFASHPSLYIPNDIDLGTDGSVYVTADGTIFRSEASGGELEAWKEDPLLASTDGATGPCGTRSSPFPIGANGIEVEGDRVVAGNTETGSLLTIAIEPDGSAGEIATVVMDSALCGVDGLVGDGTGSYLVTALGTTLARVSRDGWAIATVHEGEPFRSPAGVDVGELGGSREAIVSSPDFHAAFGAGGPPSAMPAVIAVPL